MKHLIPILLACLFSPLALSTNIEPRDLIRQAMDHWRGTSSYSEMTMTIHRPDWQRSMSMRSWTQGDKTSLVRVTEPKKDAGNGTLIKGDNMWSFSPKINRIIKIPSSMMGQSWMGSDFSNNDVSKSTDILDQYEHKLLETRQQDGHTLYVIESIPHEDAAVVWGRILKWVSMKEYLQMRSEYYDEDGYLIKTELAYDIKTMDGRLIPSKFELIPQEEEGHKTVVVMDEILFNKPISDGFFSQQNMKKVR
ncbi:MAG: outer membrane lipoprotein-sorting protein [Gammaproteobacteria bacterium]|nr:outer membrane lipoprotein-sorting protein [Gammaproteobacteria bacterium]